MPRQFKDSISVAMNHYDLHRIDQRPAFTAYATGDLRDCGLWIGTAATLHQAIANSPSLTPCA
ncbi:hypothetical protein C0V73_19755 [Rhizobium sp. TH135]|nr:hypothetical protein C0V73_19755 [Rhizobium sp. TH135]